MLPFVIMMGGYMYWSMLPGWMLHIATDKLGSKLMIPGSGVAL